MERAVINDRNKFYFAPIDPNKIWGNSNILSCFSGKGMSFRFSTHSFTIYVFMTLIIGKKALLISAYLQLAFDIVFHCSFYNEDSDMVFVDFANPVATFAADTS